MVRLSSKLLFIAEKFSPKNPARLEITIFLWKSILFSGNVTKCKNVFLTENPITLSIESRLASLPIIPLVHYCRSMNSNPANGGLLFQQNGFSWFLNIYILRLFSYQKLYNIPRIPGSNHPPYLGMFLFTRDFYYTTVGIRMSKRTLDLF